MATTNLIILTFYALVVLGIVAELFVLDTAHNKSKK